MALNSKFELKNSDKELRKKLAAFYTKPPVSILLSSLIINTPNSIIIDPACGSGILLRSSLERIQKLLLRMDGNAHLIGVEIYEHSWKEANELKRQLLSNIKIDLFNEDALLSYEKITGLINTRQRLLSNNDEEQEIIVLANPPFSKFQNTSLQYKKLINSSLDLHGFDSLSLHSYFMHLVYKLLPNKGKFGLILPVTTSYSNHGIEIIKNFFSNVILDKIIISDVETAFSIDSKFQEMIVIGSKNESSSKMLNHMNKVSIITLKKVITLKNVDTIINILEKDSTVSSNEFFYYKQVFQKELIETIGYQGWNFLYRSSEFQNFLFQLSETLVSLRSVASIEVKRGVNGPADYFFIPNKYFKIESDEVSHVTLKLNSKYLDTFKTEFQVIKLPRNVLVPLMRKPEYYKNYPIIEDNIISQNYCFSMKKSEKIDKEVLKYIKFGELIEVNNRSNTKIKKQNWMYLTSDNLSSGNLFLTFKWDPRYRSFLMNYTGNKYTIASQTFWIVSLNSSSQEKEQFFLAWMNSTLSMALIYGLADVQRRVWRQLAGTRIQSLNIINLEKWSDLTEIDKKSIIEFNRKEFDTNLVTEVEEVLLLLKTEQKNMNLRIKVDMLFLKLLLNKDETELLDVLNNFYKSFCEELIKIVDIR